MPNNLDNRRWFNKEQTRAMTEVIDINVDTQIKLLNKKWNSRGILNRLFRLVNPSDSFKSLPIEFLFTRLFSRSPFNYILTI